MNSLPKFNDKPKYNMTIPSMEQKVKFRPYLVKEEKVLLLALESTDKLEIYDAVVDTIEACVDDDIDRSKLKSFDVEYIFLKLRSKSVGESVEVGLECISEECNHVTSVLINLDEIEITIPDIQNKVEIDQYIVELQWPTYNKIIESERYKSPTEKMFSMFRSTLVSVSSDDVHMLMADESNEDIDTFIESMNSEQFKKIKDYVEAMPALKHEVNFVCEKCKTENDVVLTGMQDFFQ